MLPDQSSSVTHFKNLFSFTLLYLLLPSLLFLGGWLKWYWAIPCVSLCLIVCFRIILQDLRAPVTRSSSSPINYIILPLIAFYVTYATGVGGFVGQCVNYTGWDNLKQFDLIAYPWPVVYPEKQAFFCYYIGYFLPTAALSKIFGNMNLVEYFAFMWAWIGVTLCLFWIYTMLQVRHAWMVIIFLLTGGVSALLITFNTLDIKFLRTGEAISYPYTFLRTWWTGGRTFLNLDVPYNCSMVYAYTTVTMAWAPNHYISGILFPAMVWYKIIKTKTFASIPFILGIGLIWSPFVLLGLIPLVLYGIWKYPKYLLTIDTFLSVIPAIPFLIYYIAHSTSTEIPRGFIWECGKGWWINYLVFILMEVGIFAGLIIILRKRYLTSSDRLLMKIFLVPLLLIPLVYLGFYNDFPSKAGIVPMFFLTITFSRLISQIINEFFVKKHNFIQRKQLLPALALLVWIGSTIPSINIFLHPIFPHPLYNTNSSFLEISQRNPIQKLSDMPLSSQFLGDVNNPLYSKFFKESNTANQADQRHRED